MNEQGTTARDPRLTHFIALGDNHGWGKGETEKEAIRNMRAQGGKVTEYIVYACTAATYVNDMGGLNRPGTDPEAVKIKHMRDGKPRK